MSIKKISFTKMCGAGNDFLITDYTRFSKKKISHSKSNFRSLLNTSENIVNKLKKKIPLLCNRKFGLGADGICFLTPSNKTHLNWQFFNSDGSTAKMCGNAACCIIHYVYEKKLIPSNTRLFHFKIGNKILSGDFHKKTAKLYCPHPKILQKNIKMKGQKIQYDKIDSGAIHILIENNNVKNFEKLKPLAKKLRQHNPHSNITFYKKGPPIFCISFERGVEDFTLSCGTGALAVAYLLHKKKNIPISVVMQGGILKVLFDHKQSYLISPVHLIAEMTHCTL